MVKLSDRLMPLKKITSNAQSANKAVMRGLSQDPQARYVSCMQFVEALTDKSTTSSSPKSTRNAHSDTSPIKQAVSNVVEVPAPQSFASTPQTSLSTNQDVPQAPLPRFLYPFNQLNVVSRLIWVGIILFSGGAGLFILLIWLFSQYKNTNE